MRIASFTSLFCFAGLFIVGASIVGADEPKPVFSQTPAERAGCLAIAQPMEKLGGWKKSYRAADDFLLKKPTEISEVVWWGCSYDGRHGEDDGLDQVMGFAIEIYEHDSKTERPGCILHRTIVSLDETALQRTKLQNFGGSDVLRFKASLADPFHAEAETQYWFSVTAYLSGEPMWVWFGGVNGNSKNAIDYGVNGKWGDQPGWKPIDMSFELYATAAATTAETAKVDAAKEDATEDHSENKVVDAEQKTDQQSDQRESKDNAEKETVESTEIERLIKQLDSDKYSEREAAENELTKLDKAAAPFLIPLAKHDDPEIRFRVRSILAKCITFAATKPMKIHTMVEGEKIADLAIRFNVSKEKIIKANAFGDQKIRAGIMVFIPID